MLLRLVELLRLLVRLLRGARLRDRRKGRPRAEPHLDGPGPRVPEGGPRGARGSLGGLAAGARLPRTTLLAAALAAATLGRRRGAPVAGGASPSGRATPCSRWCRGGRLGGDEGSRRGGLVRQGELLQEQRILGLEERGERVAAAKVQTNVAVPLVEAPDEVEDEGLIRENLAEHAKISGHPLETPIVICNGYVTLGEAMELGIRVEGARLAIAKELCFYGNPGVARGEAACEDGPARSSEMDPRFQDFMTQSMHAQSG